MLPPFRRKFRAVLLAFPCFVPLFHVKQGFCGQIRTKGGLDGRLAQEARGKRSDRRFGTCFTWNTRRREENACFIARFNQNKAISGADARFWQLFHAEQNCIRRAGDAFDAGFKWGRAVLGDRCPFGNCFT